MEEREEKELREAGHDDDTVVVSAVASQTDSRSVSRSIANVPVQSLALKAFMITSPFSRQSIMIAWPLSPPKPAGRREERGEKSEGH